MSSGKPKTLTCYISLGADKANYVGFDDMFSAQGTSVAKVPGSAHSFIDNNNIPSDLRTITSFPQVPVQLQSVIPIPEPTHNYHIWDMQFIQGDLLDILPKLIAKSNATGISNETYPGNSTFVYPIPTNGYVHVSNDNQKIRSIKLYNLQGEFIEEFLSNDFSVSKLTAGIYFVLIQTEQSILARKLVKE